MARACTRSEMSMTSNHPVGRRLGLDARHQLAGRRAHNLDLYTWEALGEALDDSLLGLEEVGGVKDDLALLLGSGQQVG